MTQQHTSAIDQYEYQLRQQLIMQRNAKALRHIANVERKVKLEAFQRALQTFSKM